MSNLKKNLFTLAPEQLEQAINPWSWWFEGNANQNQNGFINITNYKSGNPTLEQKIVGQTAGYGMQLGIIEDAIDLMIGFLPKSQLTSEQRKVIERFKKMHAEIQEHKEQAALDEIGNNGIDGIVSALKTLKKSDPKAYEAAAKKLKDVL